MEAGQGRGTGLGGAWLQVAEAPGSASPGQGRDADAWDRCAMGFPWKMLAPGQGPSHQLSSQISEMQFEVANNLSNDTHSHQ